MPPLFFPNMLSALSGSRAALPCWDKQRAKIMEYNLNDWMPPWPAQPLMPSLTTAVAETPFLVNPKAAPHSPSQRIMP